MSLETHVMGRVFLALTAESGLGYLQVDPLSSTLLLVELTEEARVGHTEGTACHLAPATSHTTEDVVMQLTQDA